MVLIRPFEENDSADILSMEKLCPQGNENYAMGADKSPNPAARYDLYENSKFLVAEEKGKVVGSIGWAVKKSSKGNNYIYLAEVNIHPDFRKLGIASKLVEEVEKYAHDKNVDHIYCYIFEPNIASKSLFTKLSYFNPLDFQACALATYKEAKILGKFKIEKLKRKEIPEAVDLINNYYKGRDHFLPYTVETFENYVNSIPKYGLDNFWAVKDNSEMVACAGLWDSSELAKICFSKEPFSFKVMQKTFQFLSNFTKMPNLPAEGEYFNLYMTADHAFKPGNEESILSLIKYFNNLMVESNESFFIINLDPKDVLLKIIRELRPQIDKWSVYSKSFGKDLGNINQIYVDIRDMVL